MRAKKIYSVIKRQNKVIAGMLASWRSWPADRISQKKIKRDMYCLVLSFPFSTAIPNRCPGWAGQCPGHRFSWRLCLWLFSGDRVKPGCFEWVVVSIIKPDRICFWEISHKGAAVYTLPGLQPVNISIGFLWLLSFAKSKVIDNSTGSAGFILYLNRHQNRNW